MATATKKPKTELATAKDFKLQPITLATFGVTQEQLDQLREECTALTIAGIDDKAGYATVHERRMELKALRVKANKIREASVRDAIDYQNTVNGVYKLVEGTIKPLEAHLQAEEDRIDEEKARIKREAEEARMKVLVERVEKLAAVGFVTTTVVVDQMSEAEFAEQLAKSTAEHEERLKAEEEERKAKEAEEARKRAGLARAQELYKFGVTADPDELANMTEGEFIDRRSAALEGYTAKLAAEEEAEAARREEEARLQAEREKLAAERAELDRQKAEAEQAERERLAAEKAREEERARIEEEARLARAKEEAERIERERLEALRPDREKLLAVADAVGSIEIPEVSEAAQEIADKVAFILTDAAKEIRAWIVELS